MLNYYRSGRWRVERHNACQHFVQDDTKTVDVRTAVKFFTQALLGRHVVGSTHYATGLCKVSSSLITQLRDSKIQHFRAQPGQCGIDYDVVWFQIAMDDMLPVSFIERGADLRDDFGCS